VDRYLSVSEVARHLGVPPRGVSDLFYQRELRDDLCPIVGGRRLIPPEYVDEVARVLRRHGRLPAKGLQSRAQRREVVS